MSAYSKGCDVLGEGMGDFMPWMGMIGKVMGGMGGGEEKKPDAKSSAAATQEAVRRALEQEKKKQAEAKAAKTRLIMYIALGALGVGGAGLTAYLILRRR